MATKQINQDLVSRVKTMTNSQGPIKADNDEVLKVLNVIDSYIIKDAEEGNRNEIDNPFYEPNSTSSYVNIMINKENPVLITPENTDSFGYLRDEFSNQILPSSTYEAFNHIR